MDDMKEYMWLIKTAKGDFFITVLGDWNLEEAATKARLVFEALKLDITAMIPRKRVTVPDNTMCTIYENAKEPLGFAFLAGQKLWEVCDRGSEYEAELIRLKEEV